MLKIIPAQLTTSESPLPVNHLVCKLSYVMGISLKFSHINIKLTSIWLHKYLRLSCSNNCSITARTDQRILKEPKAPSGSEVH